jgi:uncharacterized membrane protein
MQVKYTNWVNLAIVVPGIVMLIFLLKEVGVNIAPSSVAIPVLLIIIPLLFLAYKYRKRRKKLVVKVDERVRAISDKSARNGFIATWLALLIIVDFGAPDASALLAVVASGLLVFIASLLIYNFKSG